MDRTAALLFLVASLLFFTVHRSPAPISEEKPSPTPEVVKLKAAPAKDKSAESSDSNSAGRFDGTWKGTLAEKTATVTDMTTFTLVIKGQKSAELTAELTRTLSGRYRNLSPLYFKATNHADHLVANGPDLMIRWSGGRLIDWPKILPREEADKIAASQTSNRPTAFTLKGDELMGSKTVYHRVK